VAFVDDDEVVRPDWLGELLAVQARTAAEVVSGAVVPRFPAGAPRWAGRSGVFEQRHASDGAPISYAATNNVLVAARLLRREGGPFDPAFGLSGSGDSHFFLRCAREGARMVAAAGAVAEESVPPRRVRLGWVLRRAFRVGNGAVFCERALPRAQRRLGLRLAKSSARAAAAAVALPLAPLLGSGAVVRALWHLGHGAGCAAALGGYRYHEYRDGGSSAGGDGEEGS
jgi:succinoglycan biosynthesis protein ExoM